MKKLSENIFTKRIFSVGAMVGVIVILAGCAGYSNGGYTGKGGIGQGNSRNFANNSVLSNELNRGDQLALEEGFLGAMNTLDAGVPRDWRGERSEGTVTAGSFLIANLLPNPDDTLPARTGLSLSYRLETEQGKHVLAKNSNIRRGPSTNYDVLETLPSGTGVDGVGRVEGETWMLVAVNGAVRGYVHEKLLVKAPGTGAFELAGGPVREPVLCREYSQSLLVRGQRDRWNGIACDYGSGWELEQRTGPTLLGQAY